MKFPSSTSRTASKENIVLSRHGFSVSTTREAKCDGNSVSLKTLPCNASTQEQNPNETIADVNCTWRKLSAHPNILPPLPPFIHPWQEGTNIAEYLCLNPQADRLRLVSELSDALSFLHSSGISHGNLHPGNILISKTETIWLTDLNLFGLREQLWFSTAVYEPVRYMPPERLLSNFTPTPAYDCFAFASVSFEILSDLQPFSDHLSPADVILALYHHQSPFMRPSKRVLTIPELDDILWGLMCKCWNLDPTARPQMLSVDETLRKIRTQVVKASWQARL